MTLTEFLLARIAEDEDAARVEAGWAVESPKWRRAFAECEAKRRIIEAGDDLVREHRFTTGADEFTAGRYCQRAEFYRDLTLRLLALPHADHPDFNEAWHPDTP